MEETARRQHVIHAKKRQLTFAAAASNPCKPVHRGDSPQALFHATRACIFRPQDNAHLLSSHRRQHDHRFSLDIDANHQLGHLTKCLYSEDVSIDGRVDWAGYLEGQSHP